METLKRNLQTLGFSDEEVIIYLAALEEGSTTPLSLARTTGIPRTTVYLLIESLVEKKLLSLADQDGKKSYTAAAPENLIKLAQQRKTELQETVLSIRNELPQLQALFERTQNKPEISYYSGTDEATKILKVLSLHEPIFIYRYIPTVQTGGSVILRDMIEHWEQEMVPMKEILIGLEEQVDGYVKKYQSSRHQIFPLRPKIQSHISQIITGDMVVYVLDYPEDIMVIRIKDPSIAQFEHMRFTMIADAVATS